MSSLLDIPDGQSATILGLSLPAAAAARLMEFGLMEGCRVTVLRRAPLGDPLELQVGGARISIRGAEARGIEVAP